MTFVTAAAAAAIDENSRADDNADMRDYRRPVGAIGVNRSAAALCLDAVRQRRPTCRGDVDAGLDGSASALRADEDTRTIPFILVSARAGEEARIEGLRAGADDYLVKPFSARELVARVETQLVRAKMRSLEEAHTLKLTSVFAHAPVGVAILDGPDHIFEFANSQYLDLVARRDVVGKPAREALSELAGQGIYEILDGVYASGKPFVGRSVRAVIQRRLTVPEETFFDFVYQPLFDDQGGDGTLSLDDTSRTPGGRPRRRIAQETNFDAGHELHLSPDLTALQLMRLRDVSGAARTHDHRARHRR